MNIRTCDYINSWLGSFFGIRKCAPIAFSFFAALAMVGCAPKTPPSASVSPKPQVLSKYDAIATEQKDLKTRLDAQMNAMLALQEHMAALEDRMGMLEQDMKPSSSDVAIKSRGPIRRRTNKKPISRHRLTHARIQLINSHNSVKPNPSMTESEPSPHISKAESPGIQNNYDAAIRLLKHGDYDAASAALAQFVKTYPDADQMPNARYWLGEALFAKEDFDRVISALRPFESMPVSTAKRAPALFRLGASYQRVGSNADAIMAFNILRRDYPKSVEASNAAKQLKQLKQLGTDGSTLSMQQAQPKSAMIVTSPLVMKKVKTGTHYIHKWAVNIISVGTRAEAKHVQNHLYLMGFHAKVMKVKVRGKLWYRLRAIGFTTRKKADDARQIFVKKGYTGAWASPE